MSDPCFQMGCIDWIGSDTCGECGRWTGAKAAHEAQHKESVERWVDEATDKMHSCKVREP